MCPPLWVAPKYDHVRVPDSSYPTVVPPFYTLLSYYFIAMNPPPPPHSPSPRLTQQGGGGGGGTYYGGFNLWVPPPPLITKIVVTPLLERHGNFNEMVAPSVSWSRLVAGVSIDIESFRPAAKIVLVFAKKNPRHTICLRLASYYCGLLVYSFDKHSVRSLLARRAPTLFFLPFKWIPQGQSQRPSVFVRACLRACVLACVRACVRACVCACVSASGVLLYACVRTHARERRRCAGGPPTCRKRRPTATSPWAAAEVRSRRRRRRRRGREARGR